MIRKETALAFALAMLLLGNMMGSYFANKQVEPVIEELWRGYKDMSNKNKELLKELRRDW